MVVGMQMRLRGALATLSAAVALGAALLAPTGAGAATVVNGDFETGTLAGWQLYNSGESMGAPGSWLAYTGTSIGGGEFPTTVAAPPAGNYAAITFQTGPGLHILYQDVALEPYYAHQLSMLVYYRSDASLFSANTFQFLGESPNQQYRVDVLKAGAPIETLNPADILATPFNTITGGPQTLAATPISTDLTPFAGQTVRLRFAEVDNEGIFNAATDSVAIQSTPPSNAAVLGKVKLNKKNGSAKLTVTVPGAGKLKVADVKKKKKRIKAKTLTAATAGAVKLSLQPTGSAKQTLKEKGKLKLKVKVTFTPTGGIAATQQKTLTLKLNLPKG